MRKEDILKSIQTSVDGKSTVKICFKDETRPVVIGKFVALKDNEQLKAKSMCRFVSKSKLDLFQESIREDCPYGHVMYTRILTLESILFITHVKPEHEANI